MSTTTTTPVSYIELDSDNPGTCWECDEAIYDHNDACDGGHGEFAAMIALESNADHFVTCLDELLSEVTDPRSGWHIAGENMGWQHRSGQTWRAELTGTTFVELVAGDVGSFRLRCATVDGKLTAELWHHDAPFAPERFTVTPMRKAAAAKLGLV